MSNTVDVSNIQIVGSQLGDLNVCIKGFDPQTLCKTENGEKVSALGKNELGVVYTIDKNGKVKLVNIAKSKVVVISNDEKCTLGFEDECGDVVEVSGFVELIAKLVPDFKVESGKGTHVVQDPTNPAAYTVNGYIIEIVQDEEDPRNKSLKITDPVTCKDTTCCLTQIFKKANEFGYFAQCGDADTQMGVGFTIGSSTAQGKECHITLFDAQGQESSQTFDIVKHVLDNCDILCDSVEILEAIEEVNCESTRVMVFNVDADGKATCGYATLQELLNECDAHTDYGTITDEVCQDTPLAPVATGPVPTNPPVGHSYEEYFTQNNCLVIRQRDGNARQLQRIDKNCCPDARVDFATTDFINPGNPTTGEVETYIGNNGPYGPGTLFCYNVQGTNENYKRYYDGTNTTLIEEPVTDAEICAAVNRECPQSLDSHEVNVSVNTLTSTSVFTGTDGSPQTQSDTTNVITSVECESTPAGLQLEINGVTVLIPRAKLSENVVIDTDDTLGLIQDGAGDLILQLTDDTNAGSDVNQVNLSTLFGVACTTDANGNHVISQGGATLCTIPVPRVLVNKSFTVDANGLATILCNFSDGTTQALTAQVPDTDNTYNDVNLVDNGDGTFDITFVYEDGTTDPITVGTTYKKCGGANLSPSDEVITIDSFPDTVVPTGVVSGKTNKANQRKEIDIVREGCDIKGYIPCCDMETSYAGGSNVTTIDETFTLNSTQTPTIVTYDRTFTNPHNYPAKLRFKAWQRVRFYDPSAIVGERVQARVNNIVRINGTLYYGRFTSYKANMFSNLFYDETKVLDIVNLPTIPAGGTAVITVEEGFDPMEKEPTLASVSALLSISDSTVEWIPLYCNG